MSKSTPSASERRELLAFHGALCLVLATLEYLIPKPIPFMRVGLANLPILLALRGFDAATVLLLVLLKILGQGLVGGTLFSYVFLFSAAGSSVAGLAMLGILRLGGKRISLVGVSVIGALASNCTQVLLAVSLVFGRGGVLIGPPFLAVGTLSGLILGLFAEAFERSSSWISATRALLAGTAAPPPPPASESARPPSSRPRRKRRPDLIGRIVARRDSFLAGVAALPAFLFLNRLEGLLALVPLFILLTILAGRRFRPVFPIVATLGIVAANLLMPSGRVLLSLGSVSITSGALLLGARKSLTFVGLVYLSFFSVRPGLKLPGRFGGLFARVIYYFERLLEADKRLDRRDALGSLDRFLWKVFPPDPSERPAVLARERAAGGREEPTARTRAGGWALLAGVVLLPWAALALQIASRHGA